MSYDPLMRWESEDGAVGAAIEDNHHRDRSQPKRSSRRWHGHRDRPVVQTGPYLGERRWVRGVVAR
jgi:hypothetical protein